MHDQSNGIRDDSRNKKILLISYHFPPDSTGAGQRFLSVLPELLSQGYVVFVVIPSQIDSPYLMDSFHALPEGVRVLKAYSPKFHFLRDKVQSKKHSILGNYVRKFYQSIPFDKGIIFSLTSFWHSRKLIRRHNIDAVVTTVPLFSTLITGLLLRRFQDVTWICDVRDFYYLHNMEYQPRITKRVHKILESLSMKLADEIIFVSNQMRSRYGGLYRSIVNKSTIIYNGFGNIQIMDHSGTEISSISLIHLGSFYSGERSPCFFLRHFQELILGEVITREDYHVAFLGDLGSGLRNQMKEEGLYALIDRDETYSRTAALNELQGADVGLLFIPNDPKHKWTIPIKMFDYISMQKPILAFVPTDSEVAKIISSYSIGLVVSEEDVSTHPALDVFFEKPHRFIGKAREAYQRNWLDLKRVYSKENNAKTFIQVVKRVLS